MVWDTFRCNHGGFRMLNYKMFKYQQPSNYCFIVKLRFILAKLRSRSPLWGRITIFINDVRLKRITAPAAAAACPGKVRMVILPVQISEGGNWNGSHQFRYITIFLFKSCILSIANLTCKTIGMAVVKPTQCCSKCYLQIRLTCCAMRRNLLKLRLKFTEEPGMQIANCC